MEPSVDDQTARRAALAASLALLFFAALTAFALLGWFHQNPSPWTWKSLLAVVCSAGAVVTSALVHLMPSRATSLLGIAVMLVSLVRIGPPVEWTWASFALLAITFVLLMPLVHAAIVLRSDA